LPRRRRSSTTSAPIPARRAISRAKSSPSSRARERGSWISAPGGPTPAPTFRRTPPSGCARSATCRAPPRRSTRRRRTRPGRHPARAIAAWYTFERELTRLSSGDARGALPGLSKLARAYPDAPVFQATYARALKDTGRARDAVDLYRRLLAKWPRDATMYHDLAVAAQAAGMPQEAARAEQASLALQPGNAVASNGLGLLQSAAGHATEAVTSFERATQDDPSNAMFWTNLGNARRETEDAARAEQAYRHALELDPRSVDAANGLGVLLVQQKRPVDAIPWFERAIAGSSKFVEARLNLGIAYQ